MAKELEVQKEDNPEGLVVQYVDDILLVMETNEKCVELTLAFEFFCAKEVIKYLEKRLKSCDNK